MAKEWIENIAQQIKEHNREAADQYALEQHRAEIVGTQGRIFFGDLVRCLDDNFTQIRRQLQGDPTAGDITIATTGATQVRMTRSRFPWFDAHITHQDALVTLEYSKAHGVAQAPDAENKTIAFDFRVSPDDKLSVEEQTTGAPITYTTPEELGQRITELLFEV